MQFSLFVFTLHHSSSSLCQGIWILKPYAGACGRGIGLISKAAGSKVPKERRIIAQKYIHNPFLIDGRKFDLRIYVLVTHADPLRIYLFKDGLARFATAKYTIDPSTLKNRYMHLTNYSVNKRNEEFEKNQDADDDGVGSKWSLQALLRFFEQQGIDKDQVMGSISDVIIKTIIAVEGEVNTLLGRYCRNRTKASTSGSPCYELFGFDILLDAKLRAWLLEVNVLPSLSSSSPMDKKIKNTLLTDVLHLVGFVPFNPKRLAKDEETKKKKRLLGRGEKKEKQKTARELLDCSLDDLTDSDIEVLCDFEDEFARRGHFERIFPTPNTSHYYQYFPVPRYHNVLVDLWVNKWRPQHGPQVLNQQLLRRRAGLKSTGSSQRSENGRRSGANSAAIARLEHVHSTGPPMLGVLGSNGKLVTAATVAKCQFKDMASSYQKPMQPTNTVELQDVVVRSPDRVAQESKARNGGSSWLITEGSLAAQRPSASVGASKEEAVAESPLVVEALPDEDSHAMAQPKSKPKPKPAPQPVRQAPPEHPFRRQVNLNDTVSSDSDSEQQQRRTTKERTQPLRLRMPSRQGAAAGGSGDMPAPSPLSAQYMDTRSTLSDAYVQAYGRQGYSAPSTTKGALGITGTTMSLALSPRTQISRPLTSRSTAQRSPTKGRIGKQRLAAQRSPTRADAPLTSVAAMMSSGERRYAPSPVSLNRGYR